MPLYSSPIFPKIILLDIRLAIVGGEGGGGGCLIVLTKYKIMLLDYLNAIKFQKKKRKNILIIFL